MFRLRRRSWPGRLVRWPGLFWLHYRTFVRAGRPHPRRWQAAKDAFRITALLLRP
jgi:hypothetical protein